MSIQWDRSLDLEETREAAMTPEERERLHEDLRPVDHDIPAFDDEPIEEPRRVSKRKRRKVTV